MITHPASGYHYVNIFPRNVVFSEIHASYRASSLENPWMSAQFLDEGLFPLDDPTAFLIFWQAIPDGLTQTQTRAKKALRYCESMPVDPARTENQRDHFAWFEKTAGSVDCVIAHTPTAVRILGAHARSVILAPVGYEPSVYGTPDWDASKTVDIGFYGSMVGKREEVLAHLPGKVGVYNTFGPERKRQIDRCRMSLYIGHCEDPSFATMRLWQSIATSAALAIEGDRDAWPAVPGRHYLQLPKADPGDMSGFLDSIERALEVDLETMARVAHNELSRFTVKECMENYVVPCAGTV